MKPNPADTNSDNSAPVVTRMEAMISRLLRGGVITSMATIALGTALLFVRHPAYLTSTVELKRLTAPGAAFPRTAREVADGVLAGRGQAVIALGLILLIATPILRVAASAVAFAKQGDGAFTAISLAVLVVLLISFLFGKVE